MLDLLTSNPFVAFVGAGASAVPPSRLPTWTGFNNLLLESLGERLDEYSRKSQPTEAMLEEFRARRDQTGFFAPDFQAQLMEEQIGEDYFAVWQSLDTGAYGPAHAGLAELAVNERLAAIVTTNFDRLIESALQARGIVFEVFHDAAGFEKLLASLQGERKTLALVKIHGSIEDTASLVDTLRQRLAGRPSSLHESLQLLLRRYAWLYLGFSGADFSYDPHYLGVLDAAAQAKGFVFVARPGSDLQPGVRQIAEAYGSEKATIVSGDLSTWLAESFELPAPTVPAAASPEDTSAHVRQKIGEWVARLGSMAVVNILCAMLKSAGREHAAFWLMRKTWKSYRHGDETHGKSYWRYQYNYGLSLFNVGLIRNPVAMKEDKSNLLEWKTHADQNAFEFLARSYSQGKLLTAGGYLASLMAYRGEVGRAIALAHEVSEEARKRESWLDVIDIAIASNVIYDIVQIFASPARELIALSEKAKELGDEPRRAMLAALLGRMLIYTRHFDASDAALKEAERIGTRLDLKKVLLTARAARGLWLCDSRTSLIESVQTLSALANELRAFDKQPLVTKVDLSDPTHAESYLNGSQPIRCRVLLDLTRAALFAGNTDVINSSLDELDELTVESFPGYVPHYYLQYVQCLADQDQPALIADLLRRARQVGKDTGNPNVDAMADHIEKQLAN